MSRTKRAARSESSTQSGRGISYQGKTSKHIIPRPRRSGKQKWRQYEAEKQIIAARHLEPEEYEEEIKRIAARLKI